MTSQHKSRYLLLFLTFWGAVASGQVAKTKITVLTIQKKQAETGTQFGCKDWKLNKKDIVQIMRSSVPINNHDFMYLYDVLPCLVEGTLQTGGKKYTYSVNAGSFMTLSNGDTTYYYGCSAKECEKYFLTTGGDPARDMDN